MLFALTFHAKDFNRVLYAPATTRASDLFMKAKNQEQRQQWSPGSVFSVNNNFDKLHLLTSLTAVTT